MNQTVNIFHLAPYPYYSGGIDTWLNNLLSSMNQNFNIKIYCPKPSTEQLKKGKFFDDSSFSNVEIIYLPSFTGYLSMGLWGIKSFFAIRNQIDKKALNIVLSTIPTMLPVVLLKMTLTLKGRVICSVRGNLAQDVIDLNKSKLFQVIVKCVERVFLSFANLIVANGSDTSEYLKKFYNIDSLVIPNGFTDLERLSNLDEDVLKLEKLKRNGVKIVTHVGTLRPIKGVGEIISAFSSKYLIGNKNVRLVFIGKGDMDYYENLCRDKEVNAIFLGEKVNVDNYYDLADVVINISGGSGVSNSLIESMNRGCTVISWNKLTFSQVINDNKNGFLVEYNNINELGKKIAFLVENDNFLNKNNVKSSVNKYKWKTIYPKWERIIRSNHDN